MTARKPGAGLPYAFTTSGTAARDEITRILRRFGCQSVGFMDDFDNHSVMLAFTHRGRQIQLRASALGWAKLWLRENPWTSRSRSTQKEHEAGALKQGLIAVNSLLRDWIKGQITAIECGILEFEAVFLPYVMLQDGRPLIEKIKEDRLLLPAPDKVA